ncbi:hypothetical protein [Azovibrio restrictus]|uniref:hypothetical protein n=1 Tax=Azovibrio restrictus TaxID=146938 RepID=UPI0026EEF870|nr:hypothetical protein [Azovibrio restrictus]
MHELIASLPGDSRAAARHLNRECVCLATDHQALQRALEAGGGLDYPSLRQSHPYLFSDTVVFVSEVCLRQMADFIAAMETVVALPAYQEAVLAWAPEIARHDPGHPGVFLGYDFHLDPAGPRLIEINTNAGGGLLNTHLARAQQDCCGPLADFLGRPFRHPDPEAAFVAMFREEWRLARGDQPLTRVAIVDTDPASQYLAPEFELFRQLFVTAGIDACIADPSELSWDGVRLQHARGPVDLVYNRLTDFALEEAAHAHLKAAYLAGAALLTPHPRAHALYADKRNLVLLSDPDWLTAAGVAPRTREQLLAAIPRTLPVTAAAGETFWQTRRQWFFKPAAGFGSRAAYRGDKLTKRVFEEILAGNYIAQALVPPSERRLQVGGELTDLKLDLRNYVYRGRVQLVAARLYQGQTTNFRTPGGGFAAVLEVPEGRQEQS